MLKNILYYLLLLTTSVRLADVIYLLANKKTNLPFAVLAVTCVMIAYGILLLVKKLFGNVTLKQLMAFYMVQTVMVAFNLFYVSMTSPLRVTAMETLIVGTFFDILINLCVIYFCTKQLRSHYFAVAPSPAATLNRHG